jgi:hypothetical protein
MPETKKVETVVTAREQGINENMMARTTGDIPNVLVKALSPLRIMATRAARVYLQSLVGMLGLVMSGFAEGSLITPEDFGGKLMMAAGFALAPSVMTLVQNAAELFARLDETRPELRA